MRTILLQRTWMLGTLLMLATLTVGCSQPTSDDGATQVTDTAQDEHSGHDHSGWWCAEHGIPEAECSLCSSTAAAKFKEQGDWCEEHNCAESQCFKCDPTRAEKYAKLYEAKFGHKPPAMAE